MTCYITLLTSVTQASLTKTFSGPDLEVQPFKIGKDFTVSEEPVSDLQSLSELLLRLENEPTQAIIRGSLIESKTNIVPRNKETFVATARQWCMIDIDSLEWDGDIQDQEAMLSYPHQQLPIEFQSVDCHYHFSSSMGIKPGIRVHLWFWPDSHYCWMLIIPEYCYRRLKGTVHGPYGGYEVIIFGICQRSVCKVGNHFELSFGDSYRSCDP